MNKPLAEYLPHELTNLDVAFGVGVEKIMPPYSDIPDEFKHGHTKWNDLMNDWFYCGISDLQVTPKEGIDKQKALLNIRAIIGSFEPKHEHKEAACAYLMSLWFDDATWKQAKKRSI